MHINRHTYQWSGIDLCYRFGNIVYNAIDLLCCSIDFCIKILALEPSQFTIYWLQPDTTSDVSYYQVSIMP